VDCVCSESEYPSITGIMYLSTSPTNPGVTHIGKARASADQIGVYFQELHDTLWA